MKELWDYLFIVIKPGDHFPDDLAALVSKHESDGWQRIPDDLTPGDRLDGINFRRLIGQRPETK